MSSHLKIPPGFAEIKNHHVVWINRSDGDCGCDVDKTKSCNSNKYKKKKK
jgi:hypothetical protein